jgi:hypothetical protein
MLTDQQFRIATLDQGKIKKTVGIPRNLRWSTGKKNDRNTAIPPDMLYHFIQVIRNDKAAPDK